MAHFELADQVWKLIETVRRSAPLVHNITNLVVQNDTADAIGAVGATQITLHNLEEARAATEASAALAVNIGTLSAPLLQCARQAIQAAAELHRPWILDPVAAGLTDYRREAARQLLGLGPTVLKANASEILALSGSDRGRGGDSVHSVEQAAAAARELARRHGGVVVVTGAEDLITDGSRCARIGSGVPLLGQVVGSGCMLTAVLACFLAVEADPFAAALAGIAYFNVAGEVAAERAGGPGTLKPLLIDALSGLSRNELESRLRLGGGQG